MAVKRNVLPGSSVPLNAKPTPKAPEFERFTKFPLVHDSVFPDPSTTSADVPTGVRGDNTVPINIHARTFLQFRAKPPFSVFSINKEFRELKLLKT